MGLGQWQLSPLYDVMPFFKRQGIPVARMRLLASGEKSAEPSVLERAGTELAGLTRADSSRNIQEIQQHVLDHWLRVFSLHNKDRNQVATDEWRRVFEYPLHSA